jgi:hypothetical protein
VAGQAELRGRWWSSTVGSHVGFESLLEREFLLSADHDRDVIGVAPQPFAFLWPLGTGVPWDGRNPGFDRLKPLPHTQPEQTHSSRFGPTPPDLFPGLTLRGN